MDDLDSLDVPQLFQTGAEACPESQRVVLFNCCHEGLSPRSSVPGIRIVGFFHDADEVKRKMRRIDRVLDEDEQVDFMTWTTYEPFLLCKNRERMQDPEYRVSKVNDIVAVRNEYLQQRSDEFERHYEYVYDPTTEKKRKDTSARLKNPFRERPKPKPKAKAKAVAKTAGRRRVSSRSKAVKAKASSGQEMMRDYPRELEVRDQNWAAISWLKDVTPDALSGRDAEEIVLYIYRAFSDEDQAMQWVNDVALKEIDDPPVEIVRMYSWLHPTKVDYSQVNQIYANQELNSYMSTLKKEQKKTDDFTKWCLEQNVPIPTVHIDQLLSGEYKKEDAVDVKIFGADESSIPDEDAMYVDVKPLSQQPEGVVRLEPKKQVGRAIVANRKL